MRKRFAGVFAEAVWNAPRLWLLLGLVVAIALLTKLTVLFFGLALALALLVTPERRYIGMPWPWLAAAIGGLGLLFARQLPAIRREARPTAVFYD